jgi:hypothetical protein
MKQHSEYCLHSNRNRFGGGFDCRCPKADFSQVDAAVIAAAIAIIDDGDGRTYSPGEPQPIPGALFYALDRAVVARRVARGEPR